MKKEEPASGTVPSPAQPTSSTDPSPVSASGPRPVRSPTFSRDVGWAGSLRALTIDARVRLVSNDDCTYDNAPAFCVLVDISEGKGSLPAGDVPGSVALFARFVESYKTTHTCI